MGVQCFEGISIICDACDEEDDSSWNPEFCMGYEEERHSITNWRNEGWLINKDGHVLCPECVKEKENEE